MFAWAAGRGGSGIGCGGGVGEEVETVSSEESGFAPGVSLGLNAPEEALDSLFICTRSVVISAAPATSQIFTLRSRLLEPSRTPSGE